MRALGIGAVDAPGTVVAAGDPAAGLSGAMLVTGADADAWETPLAATATPPSTTAPEYEPEPAVEQAPIPRAPIASSKTERRMTKLNLVTIDSGFG